MIKIYKDTHPGFDSASKIAAEIAKALEEREIRDSGTNNIFTAQKWAFDLMNSEYEFIDKTQEEERTELAEQARTEAKAQAEADLQALFVQAKTDPKIRDQVIFSEMNKLGFTPEKIVLWKVAEEQDGKDMALNWAARAEAKQNIVDIINSA
ncbi:hypothetical protein KKI24_14290 [bacterium]|nr:hypothetical protein [bacterium]